MSDTRRDQVMDLLVRAGELPAGEREAFLAQACGEDAALQAEVHSLLRHHPSKTIIPAGHTPADYVNSATLLQRADHSMDRTSSRQDLTATRRWFWAVVLALACLSGVAWWIRGQIQQSLRQDMSEDLVSELEVDVRIIRNWVAAMQNLADTWASHAELRRLTEQLVAISEASRASSARDELLQAAEYQPLLASLQLLQRQHELSGVCIFSRIATCLAHTRRDMVVLYVSPDSGEYLLRVMLGETIFVKPTKEKLFVVGFDPYQEGPVFGIAAPIRDQHGVVIGGLGLGFPLDGSYSRSLALTRVGASGQTYAFDKDFLMLSIPDKSQLLMLVEKGLLNDVSAAQLNVQVRVPRKTSNKYTVEGQPPTQIALAAVELGGGFNMDGYQNYLGNDVIGASKWLEKLEFGICKEISVDEAYRPVHDVERLTLGLLGLTVVVAGLAVGTSFRNLRLHQAIRDQRQIGPYVLGEKIAQGGMGTIYRCQHALLRRPTAMKLLDGHQVSSEAVARFEREVRIASELTHPHTVQIYDFGRTDDDIFYIAMELLPGLDLNQLVTLSGPQPPARVIHILRQASQALHEAHSRGLIHRDIKPGNIMLCERGGYFDFVKVLDYGLARSFDDDPDQGNEVTQDGLVRGTPGYIAPERLAGKEDFRGDIFSLGAVGYFLLIGQPAFPTTPAGDAVQATLRQQPPPTSALAERDAPDPLASLIVRCLANAPADRPASLDEVLAELDELAQTFPWRQSDATQWWKDFEAKQRLSPPPG